MEIILTAVEAPLADAWERFCGDLPGVTVHRGSIFDVTCDAVVSPANSFGFMDGGIDLLYSQYFGWHLQERLQELIRSKHHGELLVGSADIIPTDNAKFPYLIAAPTMRVPMVLNHSANAYLAARAVLLLVKHGVFDGVTQISSVVHRIAFSGLGTGVGLVGPNTCAHQMRTALTDVLFEQRVFPTSWVDAVRQHNRLYMGNLSEASDGSPE